VFVVPDLVDVSVARFSMVSGSADDGALVERSGNDLLGNPTELLVRRADGSNTTLTVTGSAHDGAQAPAWQDHVGYAYLSLATAREAGLATTLDELLVRVSGEAPGPALAAAIDAAARDAGARVFQVEQAPAAHPHAGHMETMLGLFTAFSGLALALSGTLVAASVAAQLTRQLRELAILRALGGDAARLGAATLVGVATPAWLGALAGVLAGFPAARAFAASVGTMLNLSLTDSPLPAETLSVVGAVCLGVPTIGALAPIVAALRTRPRDALFAVSAPARPLLHAPVRLLAYLPLSRATVLALVDPLRQPRRAAVTILALALGGTVLLTAADVNASLKASLDASLDRRSDNLEIRLARPSTADALRAAVREVPGLTGVETWGQLLVTLARGDAPPSSRYALLAPPPDTAMQSWPVVEGRWLRRDDPGAIVVNRTLLADEPWLALGGRFDLALGGARVPVEVVGLVEEVAPGTLYATRATLEALTTDGRIDGSLRLAGRDVDAIAVEEALVWAGELPMTVFTREELRASTAEHFVVLTVVLAAAGLAAVAVGAMALATSASLSALERTREIGVLRACGASDARVGGLLVAQSAAQAALAATLALVLARPVATRLAAFVGEMGLHTAVPRVCAWWAVAAWLVGVAVLTLGAVAPVARRAVRVAVREALAHD
jgi:putative ABC transport system permease protein